MPEAAVAELLRGRTAADHAAALERALVDLEALRVEQREREASRHRVLVEGSDAELDRHDVQTRDIVRQIQRFEAVITEIEERHAAARASEARDQLTKRIANARKLLRRGLELHSAYGEQGAKLAALLGELESIDLEITATIREADAAGLYDALADLRPASFVARPGQLPLYSRRSDLGSARSEVELPGLEPAHVKIWPPPAR
jgi:hypothetical protein